jgi:hypothetical protein
MKPEAHAKAVELLRLLCSAIKEAVDESPQGLPAGPLYMRLAEYGVTLEMFEAVMGALVTTGKVRKSGHQYFPVK